MSDIISDDWKCDVCGEIFGKFDPWQYNEKFGDVCGGCSQCSCCEDDLSDEEIDAGQGTCFPCQKGNCELCNESEEENE